MVVELLTVVALGFGVVGYVEWSSDKAVAEFMSATSASLDHAGGAASAFRTWANGLPAG